MKIYTKLVNEVKSNMESETKRTLNERVDKKWLYIYRWVSEDLMEEWWCGMCDEMEWKGYSQENSRRENM